MISGNQQQGHQGGGGYNSAHTAFFPETLRAAHSHNGSQEPDLLWLIPGPGDKQGHIHN